ncbi:MAG: prepilin peptidase [Pelagibacterales bacterium]|nr:prepilin peptidase [Pelagibacterales bacterium]
MEYYTLFISFIVFLIGLSFGSFVNVCIYRFINHKHSFFSRSICPKCKKKILWQDNIPLVSFLILNGKCRFCNKKISLQYFIVEFISGIGFLFIFLSYSNYYSICILTILLLIYLMIFFIDLKHFFIPEFLNYGIIIIAFSKNFLPDMNLPLIQDIYPSVLGGAVGFGSIWLINFFYKVIRKKEGIGLGDAKLMAGIGLLFGWDSTPIILLVAAIIGLFIALILLIIKKKKIYKIPFAPYIIISGLIFYLFNSG